MSVHRKYNSKLLPTGCNVSQFIYFYRCCTGFRRFLQPSSGGHNFTYSFRYLVITYLKFICPCIENIIPNYCQQAATFLNLFISTGAVHVSGGSSNHHLEHITVHTASGIVNQYCCLLLSWMRCSWWWAEEPPETCRASVEINKLRNVASCWL